MIASDTAVTRARPTVPAATQKSICSGVVHASYQRVRESWKAATAATIAHATSDVAVGGEMRAFPASSASDFVDRLYFRLYDGSSDMLGAPFEN